MKAGQLDQRVTIERKQGGFDALGQPLPDAWQPLCETWAAVEPLVGREYLAAQSLVSEVTAKIRMRWRPWITADDRVIHDGKAYSIQSLIDIRSSRRELVLMCKTMT